MLRPVSSYFPASRGQRLALARGARRPAISGRRGDRDADPEGLQEFPGRVVNVEVLAGYLTISGAFDSLLQDPALSTLTRDRIGQFPPLMTER